MSLKTDHDLATNPEFRNRLRMALTKTAIDVVKDTDNENYIQRERLVRELIRNPEDWTNRIAYFVAAVPTISSQGEAVTDAVLLNVISQMWDAFSKSM